jgi:hypothetical protein
MIHAGKRPRPGGGQALGDANAHEQATRQARSARDREQLDIVWTDARDLEGSVQDARQALEMVPRGELRDDAAVAGVQGNLGMDDVGKHPAPTIYQGD